MSGIFIPPSPSWCYSNILACSDDGSVVAYGSKSQIVIFRPKPVEGQAMLDVQPVVIPTMHASRIVAVALGPSGGNAAFKTHVATGSQDGSVCVWNYESEVLVMSHSGHGGTHRIVCLDWSVADPNIIVSVSHQGSIVVWNLKNNCFRNIGARAKTFALVVACCPHNANIIAVGYHCGLVLILDTRGRGTVIHSLKGHKQGVVSLSWCPVTYNVLKENKGKRTLLLASASKDRSFCIWRAGGDGRCELTRKQPGNPKASGTQVGLNLMQWFCVTWIEPLKILASSMFGELLEYNLSEEEQIPPRFVHGGHTLSIFGIRAPALPSEPEKRLVWSYGLDKHIIACRLNTGEIVSNTITFSGTVRCIASSPLDVTRVAIGAGGGEIVILNPCDSGCDDATYLLYNPKSKVTALAWSPEVESVLAYGTGDGCIGLVDLVAPTMDATVYRKVHQGPISSLIWAPPIVNFACEPISYAVFSIGGGTILQNNITIPDFKPINLSGYFIQCDKSVNASNEPLRTSLAWNHDGSLVAVGNDTGGVYVANGYTFEHIHSVLAHKDSVQCVAWHPVTATVESSAFPYKMWLASASDNVKVMNVTSAGMKTVASLNAHTDKVVSIAWSPHINGLLITASADSTSLVWDVVSDAVLARYDAHHRALACMLPLAFQKQSFMTGSADNTLRVWNINNCWITAARTKHQLLIGSLKKAIKVSEAAEQLSEDDKVKKISN